MSPRLILGDCLQELGGLEDGSVGMILTDLPYGVTNKSSEAGKWDSEIPLGPLWRQFFRVARKNAAIVLFAQGMFTAKLMMSQQKAWKYNLVWAKVRPSGFLNANKMPLRSHEDICVFYRELSTYNPQFRHCSKDEMTHSRGNLNKPIKNTCYGKRHEIGTPQTNRKFPGSVLTFPKPPPSKVVHPTQKPVDLCRWLIRSYTNPGDVVLDATMGSGSTGVAAVLEGRGFVGIERDERYFGISQQRIERALDEAAQELFLPRS